MENTKVEPILLDTYLAAIKNSIGCDIFRNLYARVNGEKKDITENGNLSCAFYVSSILFLFKLTKEIHATVDGMMRDLRESGWVEINEPKAGCVLVWAKMDVSNNDYHKHIGFYIGDNKAVSNDSVSGKIAEHNWQFNSKRKMELVLTNPFLL